MTTTGWLVWFRFIAGHRHEQLITDVTNAIEKKYAKERQRKAKLALIGQYEKQQAEMRTDQVTEELRVLSLIVPKTEHDTVLGYYRSDQEATPRRQGVPGSQIWRSDDVSTDENSAHEDQERDSESETEMSC